MTLGALHVHRTGTTAELGRGFEQGHVCSALNRGDGRGHAGPTAAHDADAHRRCHAHKRPKA